MYSVSVDMAMSERERTVEKALRRLTPTFVKKLNAKDIRHELYGREQLTWMEYERIGTYTYCCLSRFVYTSIYGIMY